MMRMDNSINLKATPPINIYEPMLGDIKYQMAMPARVSRMNATFSNCRILNMRSCFSKGRHCRDDGTVATVRLFRMIRIGRTSFNLFVQQFFELIEEIVLAVDRLATELSAYA